MMRKPISASKRVALTLKFLATGESFSSSEYQFPISRRAIVYIVFEVCRAIYSDMEDSCLAFPSSTDDWRAIEKGFRDKWNFPHCICALDAIQEFQDKHVQLREETSSGFIPPSNGSTTTCGDTTERNVAWRRPKQG